MSDTTTPLEAEATGDVHTFDMFGRSWAVPSKQRHSHLVESKKLIRTEGGLDPDDIAAIYLTKDDYQSLVDLDVPAEELRDFATEIAKAMGLGDSGNS